MPEPRGRSDRPWSHRSTPTAIRARQEALRKTAFWRPEDDRILPGPDQDPERLAATQESFTAQMVLPVAVVGPLVCHLGTYGLQEGTTAPKETGRRTERLLIPLAHTEGGLSASIQRGILAVNRDGGIRTYVLDDGMTRDALYVFDSVGEALMAGRWIEDHLAEMAGWLAIESKESNPETGAASVSRHARLLSVRTHAIGPMLHVLFRFHTGEAAGPNMITRNTYALTEHFALPRLREELGLVPSRTVLEANMGGDKKPSYLYQIEGGHGKTVMAEAALSRPTLRHLLHVDADDLAALEEVGLHGAHASGMQSFGFTPATVVAALFAVTGQDLGMVGTSSMAHVTVRRIQPGTRPRDLAEEQEEGRILARSLPEGERADVSDTMRAYERGGVHLSVRLSSVEVGTVGGGTVLPCAETYLRLLGCVGPGSAVRLAQIVAAAVLALEVSAGASMASPGSQEFFRAHWRRGGIRGSDGIALPGGGTGPPS